MQSASNTNGARRSSVRLRPTPQQWLPLGIIKLLLLAIWSCLETVGRLAQRCLGLAPSQISGKIVLITGAAQGIGFATAELFAQHKCVTILTDVNESVHEAAKSLSDRGYLTASYQLDVTQPSIVTECFDDVAKRFGRIDILISNAGVFHVKSLMDLTEEQIRATINVNLMGTIWVTRAALPHMIKQRRGQIVSVASMASCMGIALATDYCASKAGTLSFMEAVEDELRRMGLSGRGGIQLTTICPTFLDPKSGGVLVNKSVRPGYGPDKLLTPNCVAEKILQSVEYKRRFVCIPEKLAISFIAKGLIPGGAVRAFQDLEGSYFDEL